MRNNFLHYDKICVWYRAAFSHGKVQNRLNFSQLLGKINLLEGVGIFFSERGKFHFRMVSSMRESKPERKIALIPHVSLFQLFNLVATHFLHGKKKETFLFNKSDFNYLCNG